MNKLLTEIVRELNPVHDFDNIKFYDSRKIDSLDKMLRAQARNILFFVKSVKPLARGYAIGGVLGFISTSITDYSMSDGFSHGAALGAYLDLQQYIYRGLSHYVKEQRRR